MVTAAQLDSIRAEWRDAPRGDRGAILQRWAQALGTSTATLRRRLNAAGERGTSRPREVAKPEYRVWAGVLLDLMARSPEGSIPLHLCLSAATTPNPLTGEPVLPPEAGEVPLGTYQRIIREELAGRQRQRRNRRMHADYPNQAWQFDATTSKYLIVRQAMEDGDYLLELHRKPTPASGYKNKLLGPERLRLLYYGIWDMRTGYRMAAPKVAKGEAGLGAIEALCGFMVKREDPRDPLHGVPDHLWSDQGPLFKHAATRDLIDRLGIELVVGEAYAKTRQGGIEQGWAKLWRTFENSLFLNASPTGKWTIRLSALTARLAEYFARENARTSRCDGGLSKADAWTRGINQMGGARLCPDNPLETIAQEVHRWVDGSGVIRWNNEEFEVPELHRTWVVARRALDGSGRVVVEHEETGKRYDCTPYQSLRYGEFKGQQPQLPIDQARERAKTQPAVPDPFAPSEQAQAQNPTVITGRFGPRNQPARELANPLQADRYASLTEAWADFFAQFSSPLSADNRAIIEQRMLADGLSKAAVRELAAQLSLALTGTHR